MNERFEGLKSTKYRRKEHTTDSKFEKKVFSKRFKIDKPFVVLKARYGLRMANLRTKFSG